MSDHYQEMLDRAYAEFDAMVAEEELRQRGRLRAAGWKKALIDKAIARCAPTIAEQRARIPGMVHESLAGVGVPIEQGNA